MKIQKLSNKYKFIIVLLLFIFSLTLIGCKNNVTRSNYDKIYNSMTKNEVINILGEPNEIVTNIHNDEYYWFSEGRSMNEAYTFAKDGKEVKYIVVVFSVELAGKTQIVLRKDYGNVSDIIGDDK